MPGRYEGLGVSRSWRRHKFPPFPDYGALLAPASRSPHPLHHAGRSGPPSARIGFQFRARGSYNSQVGRVSGGASAHIQREDECPARRPLGSWNRSDRGAQAENTPLEAAPGKEVIMRSLRSWFGGFLFGLLLLELASPVRAGTSGI